MHNEIKARAERAIREKVFPGCVVGRVGTNGSREVWPFGNFSYEPNSAIVREDTIYDLASVTKSIPTASLTLQLIEQGKLKLNDKLVQYVPELQNDHNATIEDLLTYRVKGPKLSTLKDKTAEGIMQHIFECGFDGPSGESHYTNLPALLLGLAVERAAGEPLDLLAQKYFFVPIEMERTTFFPFRDLPDKKDEIAPTEIDEWRGEVQGFPHDESAYVFAKSDRATGHAGLFSTAPDLLNFLERMLRGELQAITDGARRGLGWQVIDPRFMGAHAGQHTFGKTGFTGTSVVVDTERGVAFVILSNCTYPKRPTNMGAINQFRSDIAEILLSC